MSMSLNPDRATLNFLNAFPEKVRERGTKLQKDGAVTQIFGNHLFIQGRVEYEFGVHRVSLRLQGNRWYGSCTTEDPDVAGAAMFATMMERMYRGQDLPESPNELNEIPILDVLEEKLGRELDDKEAEYINKLEKRYRRFAIEQEIHDHDMVRLNPRWEISSYEPLELWPVPPTNILEFWNYIAYAFTKKRLPFPQFMESITDLEKVQRKIREWEQDREVGTWYDRIQSVNERPPQPPRIGFHMRLVSTINEGHFEYRYNLKQEWMPIREKADLDPILDQYNNAALRMDVQSEILLKHLAAYVEQEGALVLDLDSEAACALMNKLFHQPSLKGYLVNLDENYFKVVTAPLKWVCQDDPINPDCFALQLVTSTGMNVSLSVRQLSGLE